MKKIILVFFILYVKFSFSIYCDPKPGTPPNSPIGIERGIKPGRVSWDFKKESTSWDGKGFFWSEENTNFEIVEKMSENIVLSVTNEKDLKSAWNEIFNYYNFNRKGEKRGYKKGEKIAIKFNMNTDWTYEASNSNQVTPQFVKSLVRQLVNYAGVEQEDITFYDAARVIPPFFVNGSTGIGKEFPNVKFQDNFGGMSYVDRIEQDESTYFMFSSTKVPNYNGTKLPTCVTEGQIEPVKFQSEPFSNWWSSSLFSSLDPVALDSVMYDLLANEPVMYYAREGCVDNYLHEAALANSPPSGTIYQPSGKKLSSLGVHEHWNSPQKKQYSRNLGKNNGIELIQLQQ